MIELDRVVTSTEFWAVLFGALAAFGLDALGTKITANTRRQASINLALLSLAQMYTVMRNYHDQVFVDSRAALLPLLGREPEPIEYKPRHGLAQQQLHLDYQELGVLLRSHDPDLLNRILAAERIFHAARFQMLEHVRLHRVLQERMSRANLFGNVPLGALIEVAGPDVFAQLTDIATQLRDGTTRDLDEILAAGQQLREVARFHFPTRRFIGFDVVARRNATTPPKNSQPPAWWRRLLRGAVSVIRKRRP